MVSDTENDRGEQRPTLFSAMNLIRKRRRKIVKLKREADEITYLNIVAMMDMMTILLVFLLKSVSFSAVSVSENEDMSLPYSSVTVEPMEAVKVYVTKQEITVEETKVAPVVNGAVPADYVAKENKYLLPTLKKALDSKAAKLAAFQKKNPQMKIQDNLTILADKDTPYFIVMQVLYSASKASAKVSDDKTLSFRAFRLTVMRRDI